MTDPSVLKKSPSWRADIDGLRAVAVVAVLVYHALPQLLPGGYVGVDVFFVISGFLITGILLQENVERRFRLVRFYERRARRLFPALSVVLATTLLLSFVFSFPSHILATAKATIAGVFSVANVVLWREAGYFDTSSHLKPLLHLWSLGVEEQFYLIWPLVVAAYTRWRIVAIALIVAMTVSLVMAETWNESHPVATFYLPMFRAWELGAGALVAVLDRRAHRSGRKYSPWLLEMATTCGFAGIVGSTALVDSQTPFPGLAACPAVAGTAFIIWAGSQTLEPALVARLLSSRPMVYVGSISYPLYLWHWPLLSLPATAGIALEPVTRIALVGIAFLLAAATSRAVEDPFRHSSKPRRAAIWATVALVACAMLAGGLSLYETYIVGGSPERVRLARALEWSPSDAARSSCPDRASRFEPPLTYCQIAGGGPPSAVIWGDSHADHLFAGVVDRDPHRRWMLLGNPSCPPTSGIDVVADQPGCRARAENALRLIEHEPSIQTVILGFYGHYADDTDLTLGGAMAAPSSVRIDGHSDAVAKRHAFRRGLEESIRRLLAAGKRVVIVIDVPELPFSPEECFLAARIPLREPLCVVSTASARGRQRHLRATLAEIVRRYPTVEIVDPMPVLCDSRGCGHGSGSEPLYRDSHHLSLEGSRRVADLILRTSALQVGHDEE